MMEKKEYTKRVNISNKVPFIYVFIHKDTSQLLLIYSSILCPISIHYTKRYPMIPWYTDCPLKDTTSHNELDNAKVLTNQNGIHLDITKMVKKKLVSKTFNWLSFLPRPVEVREKIQWILFPTVRKFITGLVKIFESFSSVFSCTLTSSAYFSLRTALLWWWCPSYGRPSPYL